MQPGDHEPVTIPENRWPEDPEQGDAEEKQPRRSRSPDI
jgi:hypothetical protein